MLGLFYFLFALLYRSSEKKLNNVIQNQNNEIQSILDNMSPRDFYTHKMSQANLIWDPRTQAYIKKWSKNDTTYH